jgi:aminopeptidase-like protein
MKDCVNNNKYTISMNENRQENVDFINEYIIRSDKQKSILLQIKTDDFCHSLQNTKIGFEYEVLYVFAP